MTARGVSTTGFSRRYTGGVREFEVEAKNLRGVIKAMDGSTPASASISKKKPPSRSTAPSTKPPITNRSATAAKSSSSPNSKADGANSRHGSVTLGPGALITEARHRRGYTADLQPTASCLADGTRAIDQKRQSADSWTTRF